MAWIRVAGYILALVLIIAIAPAMATATATAAIAAAATASDTGEWRLVYNGSVVGGSKAVDVYGFPVNGSVYMVSATVVFRDDTGLFRISDRSVYYNVFTINYYSGPPQLRFQAGYSGQYVSKTLIYTPEFPVTLNVTIVYDTRSHVVEARIIGNNIDTTLKYMDGVITTVSPGRNMSIFVEGNISANISVWLRDPTYNKTTLQHPFISITGNGTVIRYNVSEWSYVVEAWGSIDASSGCAPHVKWMGMSNGTSIARINYTVCGPTRIAVTVYGPGNETVANVTAVVSPRDLGNDAGDPGGGEPVVTVAAQPFPVMLVGAVVVTIVVVVLGLAASGKRIPPRR